MEDQFREDEQGEEIGDHWFVRALGHPVRVKILELLNEREASPKEIKRVVGGTLNRISYHLNILRDCGCVEIVRTVPVRGAVKHYYQAVPRPFLSHQDLCELPASIRGGANEVSLRSFAKVFGSAAEAGNLDNEDAVLDWMSLPVDETGRDAVISLSETVLRAYGLIARQSRERAEQSGEPLQPLVVALINFAAAGGR
ncbi:MAG TPA: winged helix-turn-helix domain-containing protein [Solirubrobacterales bacterium]